MLITRVSKNKPGEAEAWNKIEYEYNNRNMLIKVTTYANEATPENYTQYYYDAVGNKVRMYTGLNGNLTITALDNVIPTTDDKYSTTKYSYNQFGQLVKKIDPLGKEETYEYDLNGLLKQYKDRNESIISYNRDALDRMLNRSVTTTDGSGNQAYSYSYYLTGARKSMSGGGVNTNYIYDDLGRVIVEIESNGTTKEYTYDAANNRKSFIIKQNGNIIMNTTYEYDNMNRLYKTYENGQLVATYTYDINGNRDTLTYGNGVSTKYDYNLANKMKILTNKNSAGAALSKFDYTYYLDGNQASKSDSEGVTSYKYDGLSRISSVEGPNGLYKNYGYDDSNNRLYLSGNDEIFINDTDTSYKYDGFNQLKSAVNQTTTTYNYNGDGIRTSKNVGGILTTHILDGGNVAADISGTITKYIRGINLICSEINGQRYYYLYNGHGDVVQIVDNSGSVVNNYKYDEWGNIITQTEGINNPFKYCGEYYDKETGLIYLRARYYDPSIGRFTTEDPIGAGLNWYTYCSNNPVVFFDPSGLEEIVVSGGKYDPTNKEKNFQYEFIEPAIKKIKELIDADSEQKVTWMIANTNWSEDEIHNFKLAVSELNVNVVILDNKDQLLNYINSKHINYKYLTESRTNDRITSFTVFSHGLVNNDGSLELAYHNDNATSLSVTIDDISNLYSSAFDNTNSTFYACNIGTTGQTSFAQRWVNVTGGNTTAVVGKTWYGDIDTGDNILRRINRKLHGFCTNGSRYYPVAGHDLLQDGTHSYMTTFSPQ